jgi:hypothetical protein
MPALELPHRVAHMPCMPLVECTRGARSAMHACGCTRRAAFGGPGDALRIMARCGSRAISPSSRLPYRASLWMMPVYLPSRLGWLAEAKAKGILLSALQRLPGHHRLTTGEIYLNLSPEGVVREFSDERRRKPRPNFSCLCSRDILSLKILKLWL